MSLIGQLPLAAIKISCKDVGGSARFYKDVLGLKPIPDDTDDVGGKRSSKRRETFGSSELRSVHFDLGNIRLTLAPLESVVVAGKGGDGNSGKSGTSIGGISNAGHFVFVVENAIDAVYADLAKRGVKFKSKRIYEDSSGKAAWFSDPDGNVIYLWQPPHRDSKNFKDVESIVRHYELVSRALADLREDEDEIMIQQAVRK